jgi:hypothetical protein
MSDWIYLALALSGLSLIGVARILITIGGSLKTLKNLEDRHAKCPISNVEKDVAVMRRESDIIWRSVSINLGDIIREHREPERDQLVDKMNHDLASDDELQRLYTILRNDLVESRGETPLPQGRLVALAILMARTEQKLQIKVSK